MKIEFTIEYEKNEGNWSFVEVEFEGNPEWQDDSFDYAGTHCTGGRSGTCVSAPYAIMDEDATWDKTKHTVEENEIIAAWLLVEKNAEEVNDALCTEFSDEAED